MRNAVAGIGDGVSEALLLVDQQYFIKACNQYALKQYGFPEKLLLSMNLCDLCEFQNREEMDAFEMNIETEGIIEIVQRNQAGTEFPAEIISTRTEEGFALAIRDITHRRHQEERYQFLSEASRILSASLDYHTTLASVARLAVPRLGDWCLVDIVEGESIRRVAVEHSDPGFVKLARALLHRYPLDPSMPHGVPKPIRTGRSVIYHVVPDALLQSWAPDEEVLNVVRSLGIKSYMCVPLLTRGKTIGAITFITAESKRIYSALDVLLAEELAQRASLAVDNASLYSHRLEAEEELRRINEELELRVAERTNDLVRTNESLRKQIAKRVVAEKKLQTSREELRALSSYLESIREEERRRIAHEIHDELGQSLTALKMNLSWVRKELAEDNQAVTQQIESMSKLVDNTIQTVRRIATELRPWILDNLGLIPAIEWQTQEFQKHTGIKCELAVQEEIEIDEDRATAVFRIVQETLTNVARHAKATKVTLNLKQSPRVLKLSVKDNGSGITTEAMRESKSLGLLGMRERVHKWGGEIQIRSAPGRGTSISVRIPNQR